MMEQIQYNLLFRWFIGLTVDDAVWNHSSFSKNRNRLLEHDVVPTQGRGQSTALREGWAKRGAQFSWGKRLNDTHESKTDPDARIYKKSKGSEAKMAYLGHTLMENRNGLIVGARISHPTGTAERETAVELLATLPGEHRKTVGAAKNYDTADFIAQCRTIDD